MSIDLHSLNDPRLPELLLAGKIGILPTDTVYGLVGLASSEGAIERMYSVKTRKRQPGTTIAASTNQLTTLGFPEKAVATASQYWPNAISVEMSAENIPDYLKAGEVVMAARIPSKKDLSALLLHVGPIMTTSANAPGEPTSTTVEMAKGYFGDAVDFYVDAGDLGDRPPSTIIGIDQNLRVTAYRQGAVDVQTD